MADMYNPYAPFGTYAPMLSPYGQYQAQQQQKMAVPQPGAAQAGPDWITVPTIKQVEQVSVQPGTKAWVMVQNEQIFALRMADNLGLVTTDYYRFEKIDPEASSAPQPDYVTRAEFEQAIASITASMGPRNRVSRKDDLE